MNGSQLFDEINKEVSKVIFGKEEELKLILSCWLSGGHILLEDVPGNGKTVLSKTLAKIFKVDFSRVQFTPDLLPSDILGTTIYDEEARKFYFRKGPLFTTLFLADEINRATPRTQSALLEAMAERQITIEKMSSELDELFFVMATQNPVEQYGTFPLPEAQLDRFFMQISLGYPKRDDELMILKSREKTNPMTEVKSIIEPSQFKNLKEEVKNVDIPDSVYNYALDIVGETREHKK
ncbi:MAG: AAA family ATPase, partial [Bdellovibrionota bacterium]|nr:AAA family ATPase [Bdellovibrionota bacterium]